MSKFFPLPSPSKTCVLPFDFALERDPKNIFYYQHDVENYTHWYIHTNIYTLNLPVCNSGLYTYVTGLRNFLFVLQDFIYRIDSYFQKIAWFLLASNTLHHKFFSDVNKQPSLERCCVNLKGEIMAESCWWVSTIKISILLKKGWFSYV